MNNYHTHTTRCLHAIGSERDYIETAIAAGFQELGFSDHGPWHYESGYVPIMRMPEDQIEEYISTLEALKEAYQDVISIKIGFEYEYFQDKMDWLKGMLREHEAIDYLILGQHYDRSDEYGCYFGYPLHSHAYVKRYVDQVVAGIQTGMFSYVAHPDLIRCNMHDPRNVNELRRICEAALAYDLPLEYNLLGDRTSRHYPNPVFFELCSQYHNKVILGADAHEPRFLYDAMTYERALKNLSQLNVEVVEDIRLLNRDVLSVK